MKEKYKNFIRKTFKKNLINKNANSQQGKNSLM